MAKRMTTQLALCGAACLLVAAGCTTNEDPVVIGVNPSAVADAAVGVTSGRIELVVDSAILDMTTSGAFDGADIAQVGSFSPPPGADFEGSDPEMLEGGLPVDGEVEMRLVDGVLYQRLGMSLDGEAADTDRWTRMPEDTPAATSVSDDVAAMLDALEAVTLDQPGEQVEVDGRTVVRHNISGSLADLPALRDLVDYGAPGGLSDRDRAIGDYLEEASKVDVVTDIDEDGSLLSTTFRLETNPGDYPDCVPLPSAATLTVSLFDLNEPQDIQAPPEELVDEFDMGLPPALGGDGDNGDLEEMFSDHPEMAEILEDLERLEQLEGTEDLVTELPEAWMQDPVLETDAGPRGRYRVLSDLVEWAEERDIPWEEVPPLENEQLVALYDMFFADEIANRGPAITTADGLHSRGDLVDAATTEAGFLGVDPAGVEDLDDAALASLADQLIAEGLYPLPGFFEDPMAYESGFLPEGGDAGDTQSGDNWEEDHYAGCPQ